MATIYEKMKAVADAIRTKTGDTGTLTLDGMASSLNNIVDRGERDLGVSGATVSVPAGNYKSAVSKSVSTVTQATPSVSIDSSGKITATTTQSAGYVSAGTKTGTKQLSTQAAKTITPSTSSQTAVASGVYTTGTVTVAAMPTATQATPTISIDSAGKITASATQSAGYVSSGTKTATKQLTAQAAQTITPGTADKTISSGRYLTGTQTIKGDGNLKAENIKNGVSIFGVSGSYAGVELNFNVVGGTSKPSSPAANTLWVNTSTAITGWVFSATQPSSAASGTVWFKTQTSSVIEFNALKNDGIYVYPALSSQLENGTWVSKDFQLYTGSAWQTSDLVIFDGAWYHGYSLNAGWNCTVNNNANPATATFSSGHASTWIYIDVTNYNTVEVEFEIAQDRWTTLSLSDNGDAGDDAGGWINFSHTGNIGRQVVTLPLDSLTGGQYLKFHSWGQYSRTLMVYNIKFLK